MIRQQRRGIRTAHRAHSLAAHQDGGTPAPNSTGIPVTPTEHAPGAAWVDLNEMQGGRQCLDEVEIPDE